MYMILHNFSSVNVDFFSFLDAIIIIILFYCLYRLQRHYYEIISIHVSITTSET